MDFAEIQQESASEFSASMFTAKLRPGVPIGDSLQQAVFHVQHAGGLGFFAFVRES